MIMVLAMILSVSVMAQQNIQLRSTDKAECVKSDMTSLQASFSFSTIEAENVDTQRGQFSWLSIPNTVIGGNEGDPQIPVFNELIAVPFGANPTIRVTSYSTTDYRLEDLGIQTLMPRQPSLRKDQRPEDVTFVYNESAYQTRGLRSEPQAVVSVEGTMRGIRLGKMTIEPVSYDPVNNTLRVFNDIEVEVRFDGADAVATEKMLVDTYSPYFNIVYKQMFNGRAIQSVYDNHPDLYTTPVKMLVVTTSTYANSTAFQNWLTWKKQKGINVDVQTVANGANASTIKNLIYSRYNANHPSFLVIVGDETVVTYYSLWDYDSYYGDAATDLEYASVDGDIYHDMFMSRMSVSSTTELNNLVNKILTYEKYTMSDPSYLDNVLLVAGADAYGWDARVGRPTINYAANYYFNTSNGYSNVYKYVTDTYTGCYNYLSSGVGFANYTAHGDIHKWTNPEFTNDSVNNLTNNDKYFWAMGNCCLTANFKNAQNNKTCYGETMIRAANKGAFGYIGSVPETYWYEDYYFGVGATTVLNQMPTQAQTKTGVYDAMFDDTGFNTLNAVPFIGNVAVSYAYAGSYSNSSSSGCSEEYYWRAYQCFGDGSVMPYHSQPAANNVSHASTIGIGALVFTVNANAGSYVAITKNNEILGVAQVGSTGSVDVPISGLNSEGDVLIVVTRQQRQPYIQTIQAVSMDDPFIIVDDYTPTTAHVGDDTDLSITFKNVGSHATSGTSTVTLTSSDPNVIMNYGSGSLVALAPEATSTVDGFQFHINTGVDDGTTVSLHYTIVNGSNTWEGDLVITAIEAVLEYQNMVWDGGFVPGETFTVSAKFKNMGHYQATNAVAMVASSSDYVNIAVPTVDVGTIAVGEVVTVQFSITIDANCPVSSQIPITFTMTADGNLSATGTETLKNTCNVVFELADSYYGNDGWNGAILTVSFDDGTPSAELTIEDGYNSASYTFEIGNGTHVTLTWTKGSFDGECSFLVKYEEGDLFIFQMAPSSSPNAGVLFEFDCNCSAATSVFNVNVSSQNISYGSVSGGGEFTYGQSCTVTATANEGYAFMGWFANGTMVSSRAEYTFNVISDMELEANFIHTIEIGVDATTSVYLPSHSWYKQGLTQQIYTAAEIGTAGIIKAIAFYNEGAERTRTYDFYMKTTTKLSFNSKTDWIKVSASNKVFSGTVTMVANEWTFIVFDTPFEYDGTSNVVLVADDNSGNYLSSPHMECSVYNTSTNQAVYAYDDIYNFNPMSPSSSSASINAVLSMKNHVLFGIEVPAEQAFGLNAGWNWWSPTCETTPEALETALGTSGILINSQYEGNASYENGTWTGSLESIAPGQMYKIQTSTASNIVLNGVYVPSVTITIAPGYNWFGYPGAQPATITTLLNGFTPTEGDKIDSQSEGFAIYENGTWGGSLVTLQPGHGYVYISNAMQNQTLTFTTGNSKK